MEIKQVNAVNFGAALPTAKKADFTATINNAKKVLGLENGLSLLKIHAASMPYIKKFDSCIGKLNSDEAINFIRFMTFYTGANAVKDFPAGQTTKHYGHFFCPYLKTAVTFGEENINLTNIIENKKYYGDILDYDDRRLLADNNRSPMTDEYIYNESRKNPSVINYELELGVDENYPVLKPLRAAFNNYKSGISSLRFDRDFQKYKQLPLVKDIYPRLAIYPFVNKEEKTLFVNFENSAKKQEKFEHYKKKYADEIEFFQFRQFLALKEHQEAKDKINAGGTALFGDCLTGFSEQEKWAQPDAFVKEACVGDFSWGLPALKFKEILKPGTEANKVFDAKLKFFLENYDGIRFDVGWCYAIARVGKKGEKAKNINLKRDLIDYIEKRAKEIKGKDFDTRNLIYEMEENNGLIITGWDKHKPKRIPNIKNIVSVYTTEYQHMKDDGWGSPEFYKKAGFSENELILGTNNHDGANLRSLSEGTRNEYLTSIKNNIPVLSKALKLPKSLLEDPREFVKAKFAQIFTVKNQFLYFIDVLGSNFKTDSHNVNPCNYRFRVDEDYERQYHTALQYGFGFNLPEVLKTVMKAKKLNKENPALYAKLDEYAKYLRKPGAKTEAEANLRCTLK